MTSTNSTLARIAALVAGLGIVAMSFAFTPVQAQTTSIQAQIAALQAQIIALQAQLGGTSATIYTRDLTIGARGSDVTALQTWLIAKGFSIPAGATGYFGVQTRAAVAAFQAANGISPAAGYFGPITRARVNAMVGTTGGTGGTTGGTTGTLTGSGYLTNLTTLGDITSDVREGDTGDQVIGESFRAVNGDVAIDRLDVSFDLTAAAAAGGSTNLNRYVQSVSVWLDGQKLATMNPADGSYQNKVWTLRFDNLNGIVRSGNTGNLHVSVDAVSSINSAEAGKTINVSLPSNALRVNDAAGVSDTYGTNVSQSFTVSAANTGKLTLTEASDDPSATTVKADLNNTTTNVTLLAFNAKATNQSVTVRSIPVNIIANAPSVSDYVQTVALMQGGTTLSTKTIPTGTASSSEVVFDNLNQTISKDSTNEYTVVATIKKIDAGGGNTFTSGDTLMATTSADAQYDVSDSQGRTVSPVGTVTGHLQTFQATGITVTKVAATTQTSVGTTVGSGDNTQYAVTFKMTAGDQDLYVARSVVNSLTPSTSAVTWATTTSSTAGVTGATASNLSASDTNSGDTTTAYKIPAGSSRTFTLNVTMTATGTGFTGVQLTGIAYGTTPSFGSTYTSGIDQFKTQDVSMTTH